MTEVRVLHLCAGNLFGGVETLLVTLARLQHVIPAMQREFGLCFPGRLRDNLLSAGATVYDLGPVRFSRPWTVLRARHRLRTLLDAVPFDAVMTHACWPHSVFAPVVRKSGIRMAMGVHDLLVGEHWLDRLARRTPPDVLVSNSRYTAQFAARLFPGVPIEVVYHPVSVPPVGDRGQVRREVRAEMGTPVNRAVILHASRLERWKGHAVHVEALARLRDVPGWEAWFAGGAQKGGEAGFLAELKAAAVAGGVADRVKFLGQRSDVPRLLAGADICCQPNTGPEPFGLSFIEALSVGLPVVTSDYGGGAEIVTAACGLLTPPGDAAAVAQALGRLVRDHEYRRALSAGAPARAAELCNPTRQIARQAAVLMGGASGETLARAIEMSDATG